MKASRVRSLPNLRTYRYGESGRQPGISIGVTRFLPRGVRREDYARRGYFDIWLPLLSPSPALVSDYQKGRIARAVFARRYRAEMRAPAARQVIRLLAALARRQPVSIGCYCEDESHCHRTVLRELIEDAASELPPAPGRTHATYSSPACSMPEMED